MPRDPRRALARLVPILLLFGGLSTAARADAPAQGSVDPRAQRVLDRYLAAIGGKDAMEAARSTHARGTVSAFGLTGTMESWSVRPDRTASATKIGPFSLQEGYDGATAWRTDPGGKLMVLDGKDLERAKAGAWFENDRYLVGDRSGATITYAGAEKDSAGSYDVIEVTAPIGRPRRLWFSTATGLLAREVLKEDQQTIESTLSDWRRVGGRLVAFTTRSVVVGMPANAIAITLDSMEVNVPVDPAHFTLPAAAAGGVHWLKQDGVAKLPFEYRGRHVWLRASVNGAPPADFLYDTGGSITVLDSAYAAKMGIASEGHMQAMGAGSSGGASFAKVKTLRVESADGDGVELADQRVGVLSVNPALAPFFWRDCAGVLGFSFISQFVNEIDFDGRILTLRDPKSFTYSGGGAKLAMTLAGTVPVVKMTLDRSIEGDYRLDVGSNSTVDLHGPFVKAHDLERGRGKMIEARGAGFGGEFTSHVTRMKRIDLGPYGWDNPVVTFSGASSGALTSEDYAGNVGNQILERFKCTFDYDRHFVYLEPGKKYPQPDHFSRAGLLLVRNGDTVKAGQVLAGSPAERAGIREGDVVTAIDGKPVLDYELNDLEALFEEGEPGRQIVIELERGGKARKVKVRLLEML